MNATATPDVPIPAPADWARTSHVRHEQALAALIALLTRDHAGKAAGIAAEALARKLSIDERLLRSLVSQAREHGVPIGATPRDGYFVAKTADELRECCEFLRSRAMHSLRIEARLRRISLPELLGQLSLNEE